MTVPRQGLTWKAKRSLTGFDLHWKMDVFRFYSRAIGLEQKARWPFVFTLFLAVAFRGPGAQRVFNWR